MLRNAEERSGYSPALKDYIWLYRAHWAMQVLVVFALLALAVHGWEFLVQTTVVLPLAG